MSKVFCSAVARALLLVGLLASPVAAQPGEPFTRQDSLRGTLSASRACYDVAYYDLNLRIDPATQRLHGYNAIHFRAVDDFTSLQVDLAENFKIDRVIYNDYPLGFRREGNAVFINFQQTIRRGKEGVFKVYYQGAPRPAPNAPWDGGFSWARDARGRPWVGVSCQELGASAWWPNKDHLTDEPDSMRIYCEVPAPLVCVANGNLASVRPVGGGYQGYEWKVSYPINNYNVSVNLGHYAHLTDTYQAQDGSTLALDYYVLDYNADKAKAHFAQVKPMLACFEKLFGKYPFWRDGYALVETPYWGMEHQGAVAYGNNYQNNDFGFDFIIVHESAHEYFGNSLSMGDNAELWLHEAFATYAEALYVECATGSQAKAVEYLRAQRAKIGNQDPMLGAFGVNYARWRDSDNYYKGAWMLHTLRSVVGNDALWMSTLHEFAQKFRLSTVTTEQAIDFFGQKLALNLRPFFNQYLRHAQPPRLVYRLEKQKKDLVLRYRWEAAESGFAIPVKLTFSAKKGKKELGEQLMVFPTREWQEVRRAKATGVTFATDLYYFEPRQE
jgi:aminopeptidase N